MGVGAEPVGFTPHDQCDLGMSLDADHSVDDMHAGIFQCVGPTDVAMFIEACLQFDQAGCLLARFGGLDQQRHERRVVAGAIDGHFDGQRIGVFHCRSDESRHRGVEALVGMVNQHIAGADEGEDVGRTARQSPRYDRFESRVVGVEANRCARPS